MQNASRKMNVWAALAFLIPILLAFVCSGVSFAGTPHTLLYGARFADEGADHATPPSGFADLYVNGDALYLINDGGLSCYIGGAGFVVASGNAYLAGTTLTFEGTADAYEGVLTASDVTADRAWTLPNASGTVMLSSLATNAPDAANAVTGASNALVFEGATADDYETSIAPTDPTADRTITLPNASGAVMVSTLTTNAPDAANSVTGASNALVFEGATANDYETSIAPTDPTADRTITLPDYSGDLPIVIAQGSTQSTATNQTTDVTGSALSLPDGWFTAGKTFRWTIVGSITGANAAKSVILFIDDAAVVTLTTETATTGEFEAVFLMHENTDTAHQDTYGKMIVAAAADIEFEYATDTTDFNDGGATDVKLQIVSGNASDTITVEYVLVEFFN